MRLRDIPYDRGTIHEYPINKRGLDTGLISVTDITKNAVRTKISVAQARADSLDNSPYDRNPAEGIVDAYIPQEGDVFKASTDEQGVRQYEESTITSKRGFFSKQTQTVTEKISVAPNGDVKFSESKATSGNSSFLGGLFSKNDTSTLTLSSGFNLAD